MSEPGNTLYNWQLASILDGMKASDVAPSVGDSLTNIEILAGRLNEALTEPVDESGTTVTTLDAIVVLASALNTLVDSVALKTLSLEQATYDMEKKLNDESDDG